MTRTSGLDGGTLSAWLEEQGLEEQGLASEGIVPVGDAAAIADVARVRGLLLAAAHEGRAVSYSEMLRDLGHRFTRPKMRALCRTLDAIDRDEVAAARPPLAVLVVRERDRLPGQGWWVGRRDTGGYRGAWEGPQAAAFVRERQGAVFDYWGTGATARR